MMCGDQFSSVVQTDVLTNLLILTAESALSSARALANEVQVASVIVSESVCESSVGDVCCDQVVRVSFPEQEVCATGTNNVYQCEVLAIGVPAAVVERQNSKQEKFQELVFFGDSDKCLQHALRSADFAKNILVVGTRSQENGSRLAQLYLSRLRCEISPAPRAD
jgi:hypothetical protein